MEDLIFNQEKALSIADNDADLVRELLGLFFEEKESMLTALSEAIEKQDSPALQLTAHSIKGSLSNLGAQKAAAVAFELEQHGEQGSFDNVSILFVQLIQEISSFEEAVKGF